MSTTSQALVFGMYQNLEKQLFYVRNSVSSLISKTEIINQPLAQITLATVKNAKGEYVVLTPYSSGEKITADAELAFNTEYTKNKQFFYKGNVYTVKADKTTIADDADFKVKLFDGDIILHTQPIQNSESPDFEISKIGYSEKAFRSDITASRILGSDISAEFVDDLRARYKDPVLFERVLSEMLFVPVQHAIDNDTFSKAVRIATPHAKVLNVASGSFIGARDLLAKIEYKAGRHFEKTNTFTTALIVSSGVLAVLQGSGLVEQQLDTNGQPVKDRFITRSGVVVACFDGFAGVSFDYALACSVDHLNAPIMNNTGIYTCLYQPAPDQPIFNMLEIRDPKNFQPSFRTSCRYSHVVPNLAATDQVSHNCGSEDWIDSMANKSHSYYKIRINIDDLSV